MSSEDQGFEIRLRKNFGHGRNQRILRNFTKFRPKFIFRLFLKILLNIFKLLFPKFLNFGGGRNQRIYEILNTGGGYASSPREICAGGRPDDVAVGPQLKRVEGS